MFSFFFDTRIMFNHLFFNFSFFSFNHFVMYHGSCALIKLTSVIILNQDLKFLIEKIFLPKSKKILTRMVFRKWLRYIQRKLFLLVRPDDEQCLMRADSRKRLPIPVSWDRYMC